MLTANKCIRYVTFQLPVKLWHPEQRLGEHRHKPDHLDKGLVLQQEVHEHGGEGGHGHRELDVGREVGPLPEVGRVKVGEHAFAPSFLHNNILSVKIQVNLVSCN